MIVGLRRMLFCYMAVPRVSMTGLKQLSCSVHLDCGDSFGLAESSLARLSGTPCCQLALTL